MPPARAQSRIFRTSEYGSAVRELEQALKNIGQFPGLARNITLLFGIEASIDQLLVQLKKYEKRMSTIP